MDEIELLRNIVGRLDSAQLAPGVVTSTHLNELPFLKAKLSVSGEMIGIRKEAEEVAYDLADKIFSDSSFYRRGTTFDALFNELSDIIIETYWGQSVDGIDGSDVAFVEARTEDWFRAHATAHRLYVPCILSPRPAPSFNVGPISFRHIDDFAAQERPVVGEFFDTAFRRVFETMAQRSAAWMATDEQEQTVEIRFASVRAIPRDRDRADARSHPQQTFWPRLDHCDVSSASHQAAGLVRSAATGGALPFVMR